MPRHVLLAFAMLAAGGCYQVEQPGNDDGPGTSGWASRQVTCEADSDCLSTEACLQGVCQMKRCQKGNYSSEPPLGPASFFFDDRDVVVADATMSNGSYRLAGYRTDETQAVSYGDNWAMDDSPIADVAGGELWPGHPEELVVATSGRSQVTLLNSSKRESLDLGIVPVAVTVADVDNDGTGEVIALSANARVRVCTIGEEGSCQTWDQVREPGLAGVDIGAGDIDGDGRPEAVVLGKVDGVSRLVALNFDAEEQGGELTWGLAQPSSYESVERVAVGDLNGDRIAEAVATRDGFATYAYQLVSPQDSRPVGTWNTYLTDVHDVAIGDLNMDDSAEVLLLRGDRKVRALRAFKNGTKLEYEQIFESELTNTASPERITSADFDGDSPMARVVEGPILRSSRPTPLFVAYYPPYWAEYSDTPANVYVGESELNTEKHEETVFMQSALELGVQADVLGLFKSSLAGRVERMISESTYETSVSFVGTRVWTQADIDIYGPEYAAVLMAANCAHQYVYEIDDPEGRLDDEVDNGRFTFMVPVDGSTLLMASQRYNALAEALGDLPQIEIPHRIGDPTTYPDSMQTVEGFDIPEEDKVVPDPPTYVVSDVGFLGFWLALWDFEGQSSAMQTTLKVKSQFDAPGFTFGAEVGAGWERSHSIEVGKESVFGGKLPTLPDDPETPEDEFARNAYSFAPIVYRDHYTDSEGDEYSYYVFHYSVGLP